MTNEDEDEDSSKADDSADARFTFESRVVVFEGKPTNNGSVLCMFSFASAPLLVPF